MVGAIRSKSPPGVRKCLRHHIEWVHDSHTVGRQRTILIVEDDAELRRVWRLALQLEGYNVEEAGDGIAALRCLDNRSPDLVVLDLGLPALSGLSVQQEIAAHTLTRHIPIVIVTGSAEDLTHVDVTCVLRKPVGSEELVRTVRRCMGTVVQQPCGTSRPTDAVITRRDTSRTSTGTLRRRSGR